MSVHSSLLSVKLVGGEPLESRRDFIRARLPDAMRRQRGSKRLRKKKAQAALYAQWFALSFAKALSRRINYDAVGRNVFPVEPLPDGTLGKCFYETSA